MTAAIGWVVRAFRLAQGFWCREQLVPKIIWDAVGFPPIMLKLGLIERRQEGIYVRGSEEQFAWLIQKSKAGKKSGISRGSRQLKEITHLEGTATNGEGTATNLFTPSSLLSSPSSLLSSLKTKTKGKELKASRSVEPSPSASVFIASYVKAYQKTYGKKSRPQITGKLAGQIKNLLKTVPMDRACELIQVYCQMNDPWFKTKCHDFGTFLENLNKVSLALDTGQSNPNSGLRPIEELLTEEELNNARR